MKLTWKPQPAFTDFFLTNKKEVLESKTVFKQEITYFVAYGGRGSAKSFSFIDALVIEATIRPIRVLCTREIQNSIEESIKAEIEASIANRGLDGFFRVLKTDITGCNGSKFIFKGIKNNIKNLKSISDVDVVLCEEAENISKDSWDKLLPSIRPRKSFKGRDQRPIIIVIFNPDDELDDTYQRFVVTQPPRSISKEINWRDNKYFPENLNEMRLHSLSTRPLSDHEHDWEGKPKTAGDNVIISRDWVRAARHASKKDGFIHSGDKIVGYDPAGQGRDSNAVVYADGNIVKSIDEWVKSNDLREATYRAYSHAIKNNCTTFAYDTCGGLGDGVSVFIQDKRELAEKELTEMPLYYELERNIFPFDAGAGVVNKDTEIDGTDKTWGERCSNAKAQAHMVVAQKLYNTYRFVVLNEAVKSSDMISINIDDDVLFNKLTKELSSPIWVKSLTNSKRKVEDKKAMEKRTGQPSPNISDAFIMCYAPQETSPSAGLFF